MEVIKEGVKVNVHVQAKLESGEIVLQTEEGKPLELVVGDGNIPKSVEKILVDMKEGETKTVTLEPKEAFGPRIEKLIIDLPKQGFNASENLEVGSRVKINTPDGKLLLGTILEIKDECISVDFNHPLAGRNLIFTVTLISIY